MKILIAAALLAASLPAHANEYDFCVSRTKLMVVTVRLRDAGVSRDQALESIERADFDYRVRDLARKYIYDVYTGPMSNVTTKQMEQLAVSYVKENCSRLKPAGR